MGSRYEVEVTITSAKDLKNVNWRHGNLTPYAVVWIDPKTKYSTPVDDSGDTSPFWGHNLLIPFTTPIDDSTLHIDIVHAGAAEDTKPLVGSARLPLRDLVEDVGFGRRAERSLQLKRPSGRPQLQGKVEIAVPSARPATVRRSPTTRRRRQGSGTTRLRRTQAPTERRRMRLRRPGTRRTELRRATGRVATTDSRNTWRRRTVVLEGWERDWLWGVGAVAGVLGGIALTEGVDALEDNIADDVEERVEDDEGYDEDY